MNNSKIVTYLISGNDITFSSSQTLSTGYKSWGKSISISEREILFIYNTSGRYLQTFSFGYTISYDTEHSNAPFGVIKGVVEIPDTLFMPEAMGYTFVGWYYDTDFTQSVVPGDQLTGDVTIYAKWTFSATTSISGDSGSLDLVYGKAYETLSQIIPTAPTGHRFVSWKYDGEVVDEDTIFNYDQEIILVAEFEPEDYTVTLNVNGGDALTETTLETTYGTAVSVAALPIPTRAGYTFVGWYYGDTEVTNETIYNYAEDITLVAEWEEDEDPTPTTYTITLDVNGGQDLATSTLQVDDGEVIGDLPTPTRTGYIFSGWYFGNTLVTDETLYNFEDDITLVAAWTPVYEWDKCLYWGRNNHCSFNLGITI
jgi:uncharacterized repeat protein (TIGR02543 family)